MIGDTHTTPFDATAFEPDPDGAGIDLEELAAAVQTWALLQREPATVARAAQAFNVTPGAIQAAAEEFYFSLTGPAEAPDHQIITID